MKINEIIDVIEKAYPLTIQEEWDCSGLLINKDEVNSILVCLDITPTIALYAINNKIDMIVSHHPLIFNNYYQTPSYLRSIFQQLYAANIAVYSAHTSFDNSEVGMNTNFVKELGYIPIKDEKIYVSFNTDNELMNNLKKLNVPIRIYNSKDNYSKAAALLGGGGSLISELDNNIDVYISSEFKHNDILVAFNKGLTLIDISHQAEIIFNELMAKYLKDNLNIPIIIKEDKYFIEQY